MVFKNISAFYRKDVATLVRVCSSINYNNLSKSQIEDFKSKVENHCDVVILPVEFSIEHYRENGQHIASYCKYDTIRFDEEKNSYTVGYFCEHRCKVVNIRVENNSLNVDIELLDDQKLLPVHEKAKGEIVERFKEYIKYDDVGLRAIEGVKNSTDIEDLILNIVLACRFEVDAKRKLVEEPEASKRLEILKSELETRLFEQKAEKGQDTFAYYKNIIKRLDLSAEIKKLVYEELTRLKATRPGQSEYGNIVDWLDRVIALPWNKDKEENTDVELARKILDETHYGMGELKQKIVDYIALKEISGKTPSQILCLYGPPGVGKSTIVRSIAKALNKDYYGFSLGGVTSPEELNGMKRFYVGAKPGRIMEGLSRVNSKNCVMLMDEIDKMSSSDNRGDPYSVLLDVLDKNQNSEFKDKYFDLPFDLSGVVFIATANNLEPIPEPLRNRMEIINIEGYSINEKVKIAKDYIITKSLKELGVNEDLITLDDNTLFSLIEEYTFESGVRQLERILLDICKKYLIKRYLDKKPLEKVTISLDEAREFLGEYYEKDYNVALEDEVGVVNKMSVTGPVGEVSRLEISLVKGSGEQILSENLIGTAKWTFKTVFGLVRSKAEEWGIDSKVFDEHNFYIHSPFHAIKHDGPSGGVADVICLLSAIKEVSVNHKLAFTGEISLKGKVLAIGGLKEKLLAAQRNKIETVVVPLKNKKEIEKLSSEIVGDMKIKYVDTIDEVYDFVFNQKGQIKGENL